MLILKFKHFTKEPEYEQWKSLHFMHYYVSHRKSYNFRCYEETVLLFSQPVNKYFFLKLRLTGAECLLLPRRGEAKDPLWQKQTAHLGCPGTRSVLQVSIIELPCSLPCKVPGAAALPSADCAVTRPRRKHFGSC